MRVITVSFDYIVGMQRGDGAEVSGNEGPAGGGAAWNFDAAWNGNDVHAAAEMAGSEVGCAGVR
jgi:hypothetical protein